MVQGQGSTCSPVITKTGFEQDFCHTVVWKTSHVIIKASITKSEVEHQDLT